MSRNMAGRTCEPQGKSDVEGDVLSDSAGRSPKDIESLRRALYAELGELLYDETKDDERFFLMAPDLYLAIAQCDHETPRHG